MQNTGTHPDKRSQRTKRAIRVALLSLLGEKDLARIEVKELTEAADISRKTFYAHYTGPSEVLGEIEDEVVTRLSDEMSASGGVKDRINLCAVFEQLTRLIHDEFGLFDRLLISSGGTRLPQKIISFLRPAILAELSQTSQIVCNPAELGRSNQMDSNVAELGHTNQMDSNVAERSIMERAADFVSAGAMSVYLQWFGSDRATPIREVAETIVVLANAGMARLSEAPRFKLEERGRPC